MEEIERKRNGQDPNPFKDALALVLTCHFPHGEKEMIKRKKKINKKIENRK